MIRAILGPLMKNMPFLFGIGFLAPLTKEVLVLSHVSLGVPPLAIGLVIGGTWGAFATWKGRWI
ncbi:MAG: hypothetical protein WCO83_06745 [Alphaproteobacteria bacterium]